MNFYLLFNELEKYFRLEWTYDEILKGEKTIRNKKFKLIDTFKKYNYDLLFNPFIINYLLLLDDIYFNIYIININF